MSDNSKDLDASLKSLAQEGEVDSGGTFTLASERAQAMMERFLLEEPRAYVLNLIAAGVAAGAKSVNVYTDADDCIVSFDGQALCGEELKQLMSYALADEVEPRLKELAMGVLGARALKPKWVKVSVCDGSHARTLTLGASEEYSEQTCEETSEANIGTKVHMKEALSLKALWRALIRPEDTIISERCRFSPVPIILNQTKVNHMVEHQILLASAVLGPASDSLSQEWNWRSRLKAQRLPDEILSGNLFIFQRPNSDSSPLRLILNGVSFPCQENLGWEGVGATIYCSHLQKDLSQNQIVRDQPYLQLVVKVQQQLNTLVSHLLDNWNELRGQARHARVDLLDGAVRQARNGGDWHRAVFILEKVVAVQEALRGRNDSETQRCRLALADSLLEAEKFSEGTRIMLQEMQLCEELDRLQLLRELLIRLDALLKKKTDIEPTARLEVLEYLALGEARHGQEQKVEEHLHRLEAEFQAQDIDNWSERFKSIRLECQVASAKTSEGPSDSACHRCGSHHLMPGCKVVGRKWASIDVVLGHRNPDAVVFSNPIRLPVEGTVCGDCGHVELSVTNPQAAWAEYLALRGPES